jgi:hypothetical protein
MTRKIRVYARPEVLELGKAATLTLGTIGCQSDSHGCDMFKNVFPPERL